MPERDAKRHNPTSTDQSTLREWVVALAVNRTRDVVSFIMSILCSTTYLAVSPPVAISRPAASIAATILA
jgi:hypothetical protein